MEMTTEAALQKGIKAQKSGQVQAADRCYTAILQVQPKHPDANHNMGVLAVSIGKVQEALPFFKTALKAAPSASQYWLSYTDALIRLGQLLEARVVFNEARSIGVKGEAFDKIEANLVAAEKSGHGLSSLTGKSTEVPRANILDNFKLDQALKLAKQNAKKGKYEDAQNIYQDIIEKFPGNKKAASAIKLLYEGTARNSKDPAPEVCSRIINLFTQGQFQQALTEANKILGKFTNSAFLHNVIGASNAGLKNFDAAIASYKKALKINPNYADALYSMGAALQEQEAFEAAIFSYNQALKIEPKYIEAHLNMGKIFKNKGEIGAAIGSYQKALKINPDLTEVHYIMGNALKENGNLDGAIFSYKQALKINPDHTAAHNNMGIALKNKGDLVAAIDSYKLALKIKPDYAEAHYNMGIALTEKGDLVAAIDSYKLALKIKPDYAEAHNNMGIILQDKGDLEVAIESYQQALKIKVNYAECFVNLSSLNVQLSGSNLIALNSNITKSNELHNILSQNPKHQIIQAISNFMNGNFKQSCENLKKYKALTATPIFKTLQEKDKLFCDAYFGFLDLLTKGKGTIEHPEGLAIYHIGESHCLSYAHSIMLKNKNPHHILPKITFGAKAHHFSNQVENSFKAITRANLKKIPSGASVFISFGEIDCRVDEGIITASEKTGRKVSEVVDETVKGYVSWFLHENIVNQHLLYFFNVPAPAYIPELSEGFNNKKAEVVSLFNAALSKKLQNLNAIMIDVYEYTRNDKGYSNGQYHCDGVHLDARIIPNIQNQIN
jgi:tetratricopeptide (TPR) repeat protein